MQFHTFSVTAPCSGMWPASRTGRFIPLEIVSVTTEYETAQAPGRVYQLWRLNSVSLLGNELGLIGRPGPTLITSLLSELIFCLQINC